MFLKLKHCEQIEFWILIMKHNALNTFLMTYCAMNYLTIFYGIKTQAEIAFESVTTKVFSDTFRSEKNSTGKKPRWQIGIFLFRKFCKENQSCYQHVNLTFILLTSNWTNKVQILWEGHKIWKKSPPFF